MSLDVYLTYPQEPTRIDRAKILLRDNGFDDVAQLIECYINDDEKREGAYSSNITHNLGRMANEAGIYEHLWRPEEIGITKARQLIEPLREGLRLLQSDRTRFEAFNASNGWGLYEHFVPWVASYLAACEENPDADVHVSR